MENKIKVFVYGSLKKGYSNHQLLVNSKFISNAETLPNYSLISLGSFPGVIIGGGTMIQGEMYEVTQEEFSRLDRLEGHPSFYKREIIETSKGNAWIYLLPEKEYSGYDIIKSGEW